MSSVSGSGGGSRSEDVVRRNREEYQDKEAELIKKHNREIRRLSESHKAELEGIKDSHKSQIENMQSKARESMTLRDRKYQKEIDNLKQVHRNQLQKMMGENEEKMARHREAIEYQLASADKANDHRVDDLTNNYTSLLREKDEQFTRTLGEMREDQAEAITRQRENLNRKHDKEVRSLAEDRTEKVADMQQELREMRTDTARRLKNQEVRHLHDKQRLADSHMSDRQRMEHQANENEQILRDGFKDGLKQQEERFKAADAKRKAAQELSMEQLGSDVNDRVQNDIRRLELKIQELKEVNVRNQLAEKRKAQTQIDNIQRAYQQKVDNYKEQRDEAVDQFNDKNAADIAKVRKETDQILRNNNLFYKDRLEMQDIKSKQAVESITSDMKARHEQQKTQAETRIKNINERAQVHEERLREHFTAAVDNLREGNREEKRDLLAELTREKDEAIQRIKDQMNKNEVRNDQRMTAAINRYEKRLAELQDKFTREKRSNTVNQKRMLETMKKAHDSELEATKAQYEEKLAKITESHREEMEKINRRNNGKMDNLLQNLRKS